MNQANVVQTIELTITRTAQSGAAEAQLRSWAEAPGFYSTLQSIYLDHSVPLQVRWVAVIQFKNGVDKHWRSLRRHQSQQLPVISDDEKALIRDRLFANVAIESSKQLMVQIALAVGRIARIDFPARWTQLFDVILQSLSLGVSAGVSAGSAGSAGSLQLHNTLLILNQVVKHISQVRIGKAKASMQQALPPVFACVVQIHKTAFPAWFSGSAAEVRDVDYLALKVLRRCVENGFETPHRDPALAQFLLDNIGVFQQLLVAENAASGAEVDKFIRCECKLYHNFVVTHATALVLQPSFTQCMQAFLEVLRNKAALIYQENEPSVWNFAAVKAFHIFRRLVGLKSNTQPMVRKPSVSHEELQQQQQVLAKFFSEETILELAELTVNSYMRLRPTDLEAWQDDPESFAMEESSWEYQIRPCAEHFFQTLVSAEKSVCVAYVGTKIQSNAGTSNEIEQDTVLALVQLCGAAAADALDFDAFFESTLLPAAVQSQSKVLQRRVCLVIDAWLSIQCSRKTRASIYELLIGLISISATDKVVKLRAVSTLALCINDWDFRKADFDKFASEAVHCVVQLLEELESVECQVLVFQCLLVLFSQTNVPKSDCEAIIAAFPQFWHHYDGNLMVQGVLVRTLRNVIICLKDSKPASAIAHELIGSCCDYNSAQYAVLSEDGFELWKTFMDFHGPVDQQLWAKFELLYEPILATTEILQILLSICHSYTIQTPLDLLVASETLKNIVSNCAANLSILRDDCLELVLSMLDVLFVKGYAHYNFHASANTDAGTQQLYKLLEPVFHTMSSLYVSPDTSPALKIRMAPFFARFFTCNAQLAVQLLQTKNEVPIFNVLQSWLVSCETIYEKRKRKQALMGVVSLYTVPEIVEKQELCGAIIELVSGFLEEVNETEKGDCDAYYKSFNYYEFDLYHVAATEILELSRDTRADSGDASTAAASDIVAASSPLNADEAAESYAQNTPEFEIYKETILTNDPVHNVFLRGYIRSLLAHLGAKGVQIGDEIGIVL